MKTYILETHPHLYFGAVYVVENGKIYNVSQAGTKTLVTIKSIK